MSRHPNETDKHVGQRVKLRRTLLGLSQQQLASRLGITFQQVQKYEHGLTRVSASRLFDIAKVLDAPIDFFFEDLDGRGRSGADAVIAPDARPDLLTRAETLQLVRYFWQIDDPAVRDKLVRVLQSLGEDGDFDKAAQ